MTIALITNDEDGGLVTSLHPDEGDAYDTLRTYLNESLRDYEEELTMGATIDEISKMADGRAQFQWRIQTDIDDIEEHEYVFVVKVKAPTREQAAQVMAERLNHDEDYGFPYTIERTL